MALFVWKCKACGRVTKKLVPVRPQLGACPECSGELGFVTNTASQTMEVIDNGLMLRRLERPARIDEMMAERNALAEKPDDPMV